ncbi:MAG: hydrogenase maturation nickel metallochaperone HypA [Anaerolineaceae bacterium]|nr:hydrogenase maturation nickel metallochaperone HypA [Anaerolineaceae bacterium]
MHELPVTESILTIALRYAEREHATSISDLYLVIGDLSSIVDESVQFYWDIISRDTIAEGATLHFERTPMQMVCFDCGKTYRPEPGTLSCPGCGSTIVQVAGGEDFRLEAITVEKDENTEKANEAAPSVDGVIEET